MPSLYSDSSKESVFVVELSPFSIEEEVSINPVRATISYNLIRSGRNES